MEVTSCNHFCFFNHSWGNAVSGEAGVGCTAGPGPTPSLGFLTCSGGVGTALMCLELALPHWALLFPLCLCPSQVFPREVLNYTAENICKWALENQETLFRWLQPHGGKSLLLNNELKKGPALFLFIPFNPLAESHPLIDEVRAVMEKHLMRSREASSTWPLSSHTQSFTLAAMALSIALCPSIWAGESPCLGQGLPQPLWPCLLTAVSVWSEWEEAGKPYRAPLEKYQMPSSDVTAVEPPVWEVKQGVVGTQAELSEA